MVISEDPKLGLLTLDTDDGAIELAINRKVAFQLIGALAPFVGMELDAVWDDRPDA